MACLVRRHRFFIIIAILVGMTGQTGSAVAADRIDVQSVLIRLTDEVNVPARAIGALKTVQVHEGDEVTTGQTLAQIDNTEAQLELAKANYELEIASLEANDDSAVIAAEKTVAHATRHFERLLNAKQSRNGSVSDSELDQARLELEKAECDVRQMQNDLDKAVVRHKLIGSQLAMAQRSVDIRKIIAPQSGVIVEVKHQPGEWVSPGETLFRLVNTDRLRVDGFIQAEVASNDLKGKKVLLEVLGVEQHSDTHIGHIVFVSPENDPVTEQVRVSAEFNNPDKILRPGLRAKMWIIRE
ncbi:efflux RND transporter periplasmic adaptor subunit [Roseiconus lacunae]|uniref:efflux RND transporter periplasmic adaptor subunit n=1 Tax=Roseiconus lacunae TaxID=2605694 RepID=UPI003086CF1C|nr:efflux RND transporter periplasmic adaptor subunit [Stieleria sp. HD01]